MQPGPLQQPHALFKSLRVDTGGATDTNARGLAVIEGKVEQYQIAQAVLLRPLARHAPVTQGQYRIANSQQAAPVTADDLHALALQAAEQRLRSAQIALDHAGVRSWSIGQGAGAGAFGLLAVAVETLTAFAPQASCVDQCFLRQ